jgi:glycosyltransferase involved in cell wall biosynthesis
MIVWNNFRNDARVLKEAETLQAAGHQVTVFALHTPGETQRRETLDSGVEVVRVMRSPFWTLRQRLGLTAKPAGDPAPSAASATSAKPASRSKLRLVAGIVTRGTTHSALLAALVASRPDVVHAHDFNTLPTAWLASVFARAALVYDAHEISTDREGYARERKFIGWIEKHLMPRADATITTTDARAQFFARAYKVPRPMVLQNRPRRQEWAPSTRIRDELGLREDWPIIVYQGGIQSGRGLERLAAAAASVPGAYVVYVGSGKSEPAVRKVIAELKLEERVKLIPKVDLDQLPDYTRSADIGVQPIENTCLNHYTTDSNKLFEYVMAGLPVVASDFPEIRKIVQTDSLGLLVPSDDTEALATALRRMVEDRSLRETFAANARNATDRLNWEAQEHLLVEMYARLTGAVAIAQISDTDGGDAEAGPRALARADHP